MKQQAGSETERRQMQKGEGPERKQADYFGGEDTKENRLERNVRTGSRNEDGRKRLPLFLFLLRDGLLCLFDRLLFGRFLGCLFLSRLLGGRLLRGCLLGRRLRSGSSRGLFFFRLLLRDHELFFFGFNDLFGVSAELVLLQRRHLVLFVKMIFIEIHSFLPWGNQLKFWAPPMVLGPALHIALGVRTVFRKQSQACVEKGAEMDGL